MEQTTLQCEIQPSIPCSFSSMAYWKLDGKIIAGPNAVLVSSGCCVLASTEQGGSCKGCQECLEKGLTRRDLSFVYASVDECMRVVVPSSTLVPVCDFRTKMWFHLGCFEKSETRWHFKQTEDISVFGAALFSFYYKTPFPDFAQNAFWFFLQGTFPSSTIKTDRWRQFCTILNTT